MLKRTKRLKPRRSTPRKSSRVRDSEYMERVRELPCCAALIDGIAPCSAAMEAHHMGERGLGQKCSDLETVPFCSEHHRQWHDCRGVFAGWSKETRRTFARATILKTQITLAPPAQAEQESR